jgi:membrane protein DedA with SNARE-associated domain
MSQFLNFIDQWFLVFIERFGYLGIFFGAFLDVIFPIVPSEIIMGVTGNYIAAGKLNFVLSVIVATLGNLTAASIMWFLGKKYGTPLLEKYGNLINFNHQDLVKAEDKFNKYGYFFVFFSQFVPLMRSLITAPSGILNLDYKKYILALGAGSIIWTVFLLNIGIWVNGNFEKINQIVKSFGYPLLALVVVSLIGIVIKFYLDKNKINEKVKIEGLTNL